MKRDIAQFVANYQICHQVKVEHQRPAGLLQPWKKISVITNISILRFYGYMGDISADILEKNIGRLKIVKKLMEMQEKPHNNIIRSIIDILKLFY